MPPDTSKVNINTTGIKANSFDAIVIGSGISGGWAAKEFCDLGLRTLVLERGRDVVHGKDYPTATKNPWDFSHRGRLTMEVEKANPVVGKCYAFNDTTEHFFVKDKDHPYIQEKPFDWIRAYQVGGKSLLWARQTQRWSSYDFEGPARYSYVEKFAGISGNMDGLDTLPDGEFLKPWELNCVEKEMQQKIMAHYKDRHVIVGRCAHLTEPKPVHIEQGRTQCQARSLCERGCPFGGYFSSNSTTLPWAQKTGNLTLRPNSVVHSIIFDEKQNKATGVRVIESETKATTEYYAKVIFVNSACLNTNLILLNSTSERFPDGLGNDNGLLGKYIAFHNYKGSLFAEMEGHEDSYYYGKRPTQAMMPNFRNVHRQEMDFLRGYTVHFGAGRAGINQNIPGATIGGDYKDALCEPGGWYVSMMMQGETIPKESNHVRLSRDKNDEWGIPQLITSVGYDDNDEKSMKDFLEQGQEMLERAGCKNISAN
ncbi:MAG: GMC family oxidoreductase N-terminal domain-containing protein, partial [Chitinophagaceae bacterium]